MITFYRNKEDVKNPQYWEIEKIFDSIRKGGVKNTIEAIRINADKKVRDKFKASLPAISFSGKFSQRGEKYCIEHSGYVCLDFDHVDNLEAYKEKLRNDKYTFAFFVSPSGDGLKCIVKIPASIEEHRYYCKALFEYYDSIYLDKFEDISRLCFASYDKDLFHNPNSEVFTKKVFEKEIVKVEINEKDAITNPVAIYDFVNKWLNKIDKYKDGNKHHFIVRIVSACNRFGVDKEFVKNKIIYDYQNKASFVNDIDFINIVESIYKSYKDNFKTQVFKKDTKEDDIRIFDAENPMTDIFMVNDIREKMLERFENGEAMGETTYFEQVDNFFKWKRGQFNVFTGIGNYGKSTFLNQLLLMKSIKEGTRWGIFSPEQYPAYDYFDDLIHSLTGKNVLKQYSNQMSKEEYNKAMDFINDKFYFIYSEEENPTPDYIFSKFKTLITNDKIDGCIIDPYNQLDHDYKTQVREDIYISSFITKAKRFIQLNNVYYAMIIHPKVISGKNNKGEYDCPDVFDLSGGAMWNNKSDNIYVVHKENKETNDMVIKSLKIKKKNMTGRHGQTMFNFRYNTNRLYFQDISPLNCIENPFFETEFKSKQEDVPF